MKARRGEGPGEKPPPQIFFKKLAFIRGRVGGGGLKGVGGSGEGKVERAWGGGVGES